MELHNLKFSAGSVKKSKRIGRGQGSGKGGTSTKGHKGAKSRAGYKSKVGFEGGQMPLQIRVPKFGFKHYKKEVYKTVNLGVIQSLVEKSNVDVVDLNFLCDNGLIKKGDKVKILGGGVLKNRISVYAHAFSASSISSINNFGGQANIL
jgi:large subunit ribosomal protein L15